MFTRICVQSHRLQLCQRMYLYILSHCPFIHRVSIVNRYQLHCCCCCYNQKMVKLSYYGTLSQQELRMIFPCPPISFLDGKVALNGNTISKALPPKVHWACVLYNLASLYISSVCPDPVNSITPLFVSVRL